MEAATPTVPELAAELGVSARTMRGWMRRQDWRHPVEYGMAWTLSGDQVLQLRERFGDAASAQRLVGDPAAADREFAELTVGQLLSTYSKVLAELQARNLVRTNNAPIGDLAEYCAAVVYDGLLAPNSEKSHDLVTADSRKVQVKVRLIRPATSPAAVFSPIRSFNFDMCAFILIDNDHDRVIAAREWSADDVRKHGRHRAHTNGTVVRVGQVRGTAAIGADQTGRFDIAWRDILTQRR